MALCAPLALLLPAAVTSATPIEAQYDGTADRLTLSAKSLPLREVLAALSKETRIEVFIAPDVQKSVSVCLEGVSLEEGIKRIVRDLNHAMVFMRTKKGLVVPQSLKIFPKGKEIASFDRISVYNETSSTVESAPADATKKPSATAETQGPSRKPDRASLPHAEITGREMLRAETRENTAAQRSRRWEMQDGALRERIENGTATAAEKRRYERMQRREEMKRGRQPGSGAGEETAQPTE